MGVKPGILSTEFWGSVPAALWAAIQSEDRWVRLAGLGVLALYVVCRTLAKR